MKNEEVITEFISFLAVNDIGNARQKKYKYTLDKITTMIDTPLDRVTKKKDIEELLSSIDNNGFSEWTKHDYRVCIKKFYTWLYNRTIDDLDEWETPSLVKWIKIKAPRNAKKLPSELLKPSDIQFLADNSRGLREKALLLTLYESGARIGELLDLKLKDVIFDDYGCILNLFGKTGYRKVRLVGSEPAISNWINLSHPKKNDKNSYLFCNTDLNKEGKKLSYQRVSQILKKLKKKTGFKKDINPHLFRHSRATELSEYLTDAQRCNYFGWEQGSQVCRIYTHLQDTDRAILELNGLVEKTKGDDGKFINVLCPRCKTSNPYGSKICNTCSMGLDMKDIEKYEEKDELMKKYLDPEELDKMLGEKMLTLYKQMQENKQD